MLEDHDLFPIACPRCRQQTHKQIGRLKAEGIVICSDCGLRMRFNRDEFVRAVDDAKKILSDGTRSVRAADD